MTRLELLGVFSTPAVLLALMGVTYYLVMVWYLDEPDPHDHKAPHR